MSDPKDEAAVERERIQNYLRQCDALTTDWRKLRELVVSYPGDLEARKDHDMSLIDVKGRISCDYPIVQAWRSGEYAIGSDIHAVVADLSDLQEVAARKNGAAKAFQERWNRVNGKLDAAHVVLAETDEKLAKGEAVHIPKTFQKATRRVEIPWKKILIYGSAVSALLFVAGTLYFLRAFLGFWAPGEGEGMDFAADMKPQEQVHAAINLMQEAMVANDLDKFMTVFADDFATDGDEGKRELRALLQTVRTAGEFDKAKIISSEASLAYKDTGILIGPLRTEAKDFSIKFELLFSLRGGKYLAVYGAEVD